MKKLLMVALATFAVTSSVAVLAEGDAAAGKVKAAPCAACHGADGNSASATYPKIAGQQADYIAKQLHNFKEDKRVNAIMGPQAKPLSDQDIADLAAYFSTQTTKASAGDQTKVELGEAVFRGGNVGKEVAACSACHGPTGDGNAAANFPKLAGQHADYIRSQLHAFQKGERANDAGQMMRNIAANMSDKEIDAVAEYIAGLHK
ncbi:MAG TPA: cytochrome c4 [Thiothrix sp.]|nr:cytochrome c4 [Thiothrix sp.]